MYEYTCPTCGHVGDDSECGRPSPGVPQAVGDCCPRCFDAISTLVLAGGKLTVSGKDWIIDLKEVGFDADAEDAAADALERAPNVWLVHFDMLASGGERWLRDGPRAVVTSDDPAVMRVCILAGVEVDRATAPEKPEPSWCRAEDY